VTHDSELLRESRLAEFEKLLDQSKADISRMEEEKDELIQKVKHCCINFRLQIHFFDQYN
jgi:hypothetical protein